MIITHRNGSVITNQYATVADAIQAGVGLRFADLRGADLAGANLRGANLTDADLTGAFIFLGNRQVTL